MNDFIDILNKKIIEIKNRINYLKENYKSNNNKKTILLNLKIKDHLESINDILDEFESIKTFVSDEIKYKEGGLVNLTESIKDLDEIKPKPIITINYTNKEGKDDYLPLEYSTHC